MSDPAPHLAGRPLILLSNREPYEHVAPAADVGGAPTLRRPPGGLVSALDPTLQRTRGTWVAWGSGSADRDVVDADDRVMVPPEEPRYALRRVWLDDDDVDGYYLGFANTALWPLCHLLLQHYRFRAEHWERYRTVNARFADAVVDEVARSPREPVVWVQDYHFATAPGQIRDRLEARGLDALVHQFWHIPFPPPDILNLLPYAVHESVVRGMLGNDLLEFHTERYLMNFLDCVAQFVPDAEVRREHRRVRWRGREIHAGVFPISIDVARYEALAASREGARGAEALRAAHARDGCQLGVCVDRIDYTKGIPERLRALDAMFEAHAELRGRVTFVLVATPSRSELASYKALEDEVLQGVAEINARWGTDDWTPIALRHENVPAEELAAIYRAGDLCIVSSLQDGMNLVAKEFVACNVDEQGVLVLSRFTGAAEEIEGAVLVNPFNVDGFVSGVREALAMPADERRRRMRAMRAHLAGATIFDWLDGILARVAELAAWPAADVRPADERIDAAPGGAPVPRAPAVAAPAPRRDARPDGADAPR